MNKHNALKLRLLEERGHACEALPYLPHECPGAQDMHEVIFDKNDVKGMPAERRRYIDSEFNCVLVCHQHHVDEGRTEAYTRACVQALVARFGLEAIRNYIFVAPFKVATPASRLAFWTKDESDDYS